MSTRARTPYPVLLRLLLALALGLTAAACGRDEEPTPPGVPDPAEPPPAVEDEYGASGEEVGAPVDVRREGAPDPPVPDPDPTAPEPGETPPGGPSVTASYPCIDGDPREGAKHYASLCASCHGARGDGQGPAAAGLNPKPARHDDGTVMNDLDNEYLFKIIKEGGAAVGKSPLMAPWGGTLSDAQIWDVVAFVRSLAEPPYRCP